MHHLYIFLIFLTILTGSGSLLELIRKEQPKVPVSIIRLTLFLCILTLSYLFARYMSVNVLDESGNMPGWFVIISLSLYFSGESGVLWSVASLNMSHSLNSSEKRLIKISQWLIVFFALVYLFQFIMNIRSFLYFTNLVWELLFNLLVIAYLLVKLYKSRQILTQKDPFEKLYLLLIAGFSAYLLPNLLYYLFNISIGTISDPIVLFYLCSVPLIWKKACFHTGACSSYQPSIENSLGSFAENHNISPREEEIIRLIIEGKSNKEMSDLLHISFHTVKNHIYTIFRKTGVSSRNQLVYEITQNKNVK